MPNLLILFFRLWYGFISSQSEADQPLAESQIQVAS